MPELAALVRSATVDDSDLEEALFGDTGRENVAAVLAGYVASRMAPVADSLFYRRGTGVVAGLVLDGGARVVIKVHRWRVSVARLSAVQAVQAQLAGARLPAPRPLLAPEPLGNGVATVEELLEAGTADGRLPAVRRELAIGLFAFVSAASAFRGLKELGPAAILHHLEGSPYFDPHDLRFDFEATAEGAEWIDDLALAARRRLDGHGRSDVVGHLDWQVGNVGFSGGRLSAIYDWDSVALAPEPVVVGAASAQFSADWERNGALPSAGETRSFVVEYEQARGEPFGDEERELLDAANLLHCAYGARCQHSDVVLGAVPGASPQGGWIDVLRRRPARLFGS